MHQICRTCLGEVSDDNCFALTEDTESLLVKTELSACVPELVVDIVINPVICFECAHALHSAYEFKTQCLQTEERIIKYIENTNLNVNYESSVQKFEVSSFQSGIATVNETTSDACFKPTTRDVIDDLNNLLDEAVKKASKRCEIFKDANKHVENDDFIDQRITEPHEMCDGDEAENSLILENVNYILKECSVICVKLPDNLVNSKLEIQKHLVEQIFKCGECAYKTPNKYYLRKHQTIHAREKPFICSICNYSCVYKCSLRSHMMIHTGEKPFLCSICNYRSADKSNLVRHQVTHTGIKPFACTVCSYRAARKIALKVHLQTHSAKKPFACKICSFKSVYKVSLKRHLSKHSGKKP